MENVDPSRDKPKLNKEMKIALVHSAWISVIYTIEIDSIMIYRSLQVIKI